MEPAGADDLEAVSGAAELYIVPRRIARRFARAVGIKDDQNFARAMDPADATHVFVEDWQPLYNCRWLEKVERGKVVGSMLIWGQPKHSMERFYKAALATWSDLPSWGSFRQAVAPNAKRGMKGFQVRALSKAETRERLTIMELPIEVAAQVHHPRLAASISVLAPHLPATTLRHLSAAEPHAEDRGAAVAGGGRRADRRASAKRGASGRVRRFGAGEPDAPMMLAAHTCLSHTAVMRREPRADGGNAVAGGRGSADRPGAARRGTGRRVWWIPFRRTGEHDASCRAARLNVSCGRAS
jgi:hypothetical protein